MVMKTNGRTEERIMSNLTTNVRYEGNVYSGEIQNISKQGMYIEAIGITIKKSPEILILLAAEKSLYKLKGEIRWSKTLRCRSDEKSLYGMGIKITEAQSEYLNYVEYLKHLNRFNN